MERHLTLKLFNFKLNRFLLKLHQTLCQKFTVSLVLADINETLVSLFNSTATEEGKTNLSDSSVINDLVIDNLKTNNLLDMCL